MMFSGLLRRQVFLSLVLLSFACSGSTVCVAQLPAETDIDRYVKKPDDSFRWKIVRQQKALIGKLVVVDMVSQTWRSKDEVNRTEWQHWVTLAIPNKPASDIGLLLISGGANGGEPPTEPSKEVQLIAAATNSVVAELKMVPNQPLIFHGDGVPRKEDDLIGYTWDQFLKTGESDWLARNAMVKSAVRAMDTMTEVTAEVAEGHKLDKFVVTGASKRGWTTWLTGAIDDRVVAIVPIVIDVLNTDESMRHHFGAYGFWAPAIGNYVQHHIMERLDHPRLQQLYELVDPYYYRHRLTKPKLILNAAGDQFFLPDSSQFYWDDLQGEKLVRYVANTDHSMKGSDAVETLVSYYKMILQDKPRPEVSWEVVGDELVVTSSVEPSGAKLWTAVNPEARDFRTETLGKKYSSEPIEPQGDGKYHVSLQEPVEGWRAHFVELTFGVEGEFPLKVTSGVKVVPDVLPYADKSPAEPPSVTLKCRFDTPDRASEVLTEAKELMATELGVDDLKTKQVAQTIYLNWVPSDYGTQAKKALGWFEQQKPMQLNVQLESGRGITTTPVSPASVASKSDSEAGQRAAVGSR